MFDTLCSYTGNIQVKNSHNKIKKNNNRSRKKCQVRQTYRYRYLLAFLRPKIWITW